MMEVISVGKAGSVFALVAARLGQTEAGDWLNGVAVVAVFTLGSALWQASARIRWENELASLVGEFSDSWRTDSLLLTYLTLLVLQFGLAGLIAHTSLSSLTFWVGYAAVFLGQQTAIGQQMGRWVLGRIESVFRASNRFVR